MTWGIIGALEEEIALIREHMAVEKQVELYGKVCYIGTVGGQRVILVCCGIGKVNATCCAAGVIRELGADRVINVGIAGAAGGGLRTLDVAISERVAFHDQDSELFSKFHPYQKSFQADPGLLALCLRAVEGMEDRSFRHQVGGVATGDVFVSDNAVKADIVERLSPLCVEMEGAAIGQVAFMNGVPFLVIRTMSDNADDSAEETYDDLMDRAAQISARIILEMLRLADQA